MADFEEIVPIAPILEKAGINWHGKNFEALYSHLAENPAYSAIRKELEEAVFGYFSALSLLYSRRVIS